MRVEPHPDYPLGFFTTGPWGSKLTGVITISDGEENPPVYEEAPQQLAKIAEAFRATRQLPPRDEACSYVVIKPLGYMGSGHDDRYVATVGAKVMWGPGLTTDKSKYSAWDSMFEDMLYKED